MPAMRSRRGFGLVWLAGLVSETGDWLLVTGLPIYVFTLTDSSLVTSTVFVVELLPSVALGSLAGVLVDRWDRRRVLVVVALAQAVLLLPLLLVQSVAELWVIYLVAASEATLAQFSEPARNALLPTLVDGEHLARANGLISLSGNVGRLVGSSLGGLAVVHGGLTEIVVADTVSFLTAAALVGFAGTGDLARRAGAAGITLRRAWREGLAVVTDDRQVRRAFLSVAIGFLAQGMFVVLFVVFVTRVLHGDGAQVGLLRGVQAIGGVLGGLLVGFVGARVGAHRLIIFGAIGVGLVNLTIWNAPLVTLAQGLYIGLFIAAGVPSVAYSSGLFTLLQQRVADDQLGRVFGSVLSLQGACQALGMLLAGGLGDTVDVVVLLDAQALLILLSGVVTGRRSPI